MSQTKPLRRSWFIAQYERQVLLPLVTPNTVVVLHLVVDARIR
jgi:hypothetical protein